jgi:hypothetical protein
MFASGRAQASQHNHADSRAKPVRCGRV